jgi:regulatory protein
MTVKKNQRKQNCSPSENSDKLKEHWNALNKVADHLARRDHSEKELRTKLEQKFSSEATEWALTQALDRNWLLAPKELSHKVTARLHEKLKGHLYIRGYLQQKGLPSPDIDQDIEKQKAQQLLEQKFGSKDNFTFTQKQKAYNYLRQRGYEDNTIRRVINENQRD